MILDAMGNFIAAFHLIATVGSQRAGLRRVIEDLQNGLRQLLRRTRRDQGSATPGKEFPGSTNGRPARAHVFEIAREPENSSESPSLDELPGQLQERTFAGENDDDFREGMMARAPAIRSSSLLMTTR